MPVQLLVYNVESREIGTLELDTRTITDEVQLTQMRRVNNPKKVPTGIYTLRCANCGSTNVWYDDPHYMGCHDCRWMICV